MKEVKPGKRRILIWILSGFVLLILAALAVFFFVLAPKQNIVNELSFEQCLNYSTENNPDAKIGVVIVKDNAANISFYGNNGGRIPYDAYEFEIGSLTKTITAALILRAESEGSLRLSDSIDRFLKLPKQAYYPTIQRLLTHQSGYQQDYFEKPMIGNFFSGGNSFYNVSQSMMRRRIGNVHLQDRDYAFRYSNFGMSTLGMVLEEIYQQSYTDLVNAYVQQELGMQHTHVSDGSGNLSGYWNWAADDAYIPAGALISTADDMAIYARALLSGSQEALAHAQLPLAKIDATTEQLAQYGIRMDSAGAAWMIDDERGIVWHNGGTSNFSCYMGFDPVSQIAVVVLTNLSPDYRIPATVLGAKLLIELQDAAQ